ncbi:hypothetical protein [Sulfurimonas sp.]|uniref:hypothetical protein n=1 Tax=Sulfurimonas sp. TaxID=2022749 RepID=UPI0025CC7905|nr:hypothetical protein [Sulfurimonas sp.]MBW6487515.1 hypothetical protein [Sulfurimonas sp.]
MKKWINKRTGEEFVGDTLGLMSVSYNEHTNESSFYLGSLNAVVLTVNGELDDIDVEQYIQDYLADWQVAEENKTTSFQKLSDVLQQRLSANNMFFRVGDSVVINKDADFSEGDPIIKFVGKRVTIKTLDEEKEKYTVEELPHEFIDADFDTSTCILASN